jgi:hypothetical protein
MTNRACIAALALLALTALAGTASADVRTYVIAIGNNAPPPGGDGSLAPLRYADDDASAFYDFARSLSAHATLLTVMDADTQRRFPDLPLVARPPTLAALHETIAWHRDRFRADAAAGHEPVLLFFYSGHGSLAGGPPALSMLDGGLTQAVLYDEILATLPARFIHVFVDACHAEAVVRPRDSEAASIRIGEDDLRVLAERATLARFPNVGAIVAAASEAQAHEWDLYQRGVFTHELLSGLRGAADVNADGRIEYSELAAFLAAANRNVLDPRARLAIVARAPSLNGRAEVVDLSRVRNAARLVGASDTLEHFFLEDARGNRLLEMRGESSFRLSLVVPSTEILYLHAARGEARLELRPGQELALQSIALGRPSVRFRGSLSASLARGLFSASFGPNYYRGFVDQNADFVAVPVQEVYAAPTDARPTTRPFWVATGATAALTATAVTFAALAASARGDYEATQFERPATQARAAFERDRAIAAGAAAGAVISAGVATWLYWRWHRGAGMAGEGKVAETDAWPPPGAVLTW